jgi:hypothetical protein
MQLVRLFLFIIPNHISRTRALLSGEKYWASRKPRASRMDSFWTIMFFVVFSSVHGRVYVFFVS